MGAAYRKWVFARPLVGGELTPEDFELCEEPVPEPKAGEALVRVKLINIHANTKLHMAKGMLELGCTETGNYACGEVIASRDPSLAEGDVIACQAGWQELQVVRSTDAAIGYGTASPLVSELNRTASPWTYVFRPSLVKMWPTDVLMHVFGTSGLTAYFGLRECGPLMPRDRVLVAATTGSVGSIAGQLAKAAGCRVVGLAGGADRCAWVVNHLGMDACVDYRAQDLGAQLAAAFPTGIDVFTDGVGGALTEMVVGLMNDDSRMFSYGASAAFYADRFDTTAERPSMRRLFGISTDVEAAIRAKHIKSELWLVDAFYAERLRAEDELSRLLLAGKCRPVTTVVDGFDNLPSAIASLYRTPHAGKLQVRLS